MINPWMNCSFEDTNGKTVNSLNVVEYTLRNQRGIVIEIFQDGDATVWFADTQQTEMVKWNHLIKIEN